MKKQQMMLKSIGQQQTPDGNLIRIRAEFVNCSDGERIAIERVETKRGYSIEDILLVSRYTTFHYDYGIQPPTGYYFATASQPFNKKIDFYFRRKVS